MDALQIHSTMLYPVVRGSLEKREIEKALELLYKMDELKFFLDACTY